MQFFLLKATFSTFNSLLCDLINQNTLNNLINLMKTFTYLFYYLSICLLISCTSKKQDDTELVLEDSAEKEDYRLIWSEEFNIDGKPDTSSWSYEHGFVRNEELQWYQSENATCKDGMLVITAKEEKIPNPKFTEDSNNWKENRAFANYTSASLNTRGKMNFKYGLVEVKAKIDTTMGMWPAIWTLGESKGWPSNGEVDIMEFYRSDSTAVIMANAAWGDHWTKVIWDSQETPLNHFLKKDTDWAEKFHIWKMDWTENYIKLFLDDELLNEIDLTKSLNGDGYNPFHQPHYLLLNLAIGSNGGDPSESTFPRKYWVDYVRVYAKE
ncbi:glycoside hydrolase family 16 protein [Chondrinema litorale]|uniref:glycoside hydrolase family 16 protein n=1 Tax=Chondrinema litorale TaxID=2994555 RepID=UPI0025427F80|nr:glycoside hydrolase family 16 protein [Chondrinema litorale]UZR98411.1 glycoside hydrolase family 16 protein [Chondrinema litorale]